ncbi:MAG TPA: glycoside hydrolase family 15 protein [Terriglobia bacterium]|nr:glycoside hydrolase family 15 protein [Terriglobia bacterium]
MPSRIEDYALIGDCHTAALIGRDGSVDWLCFPRFDSPACFAALLGGPENGRWKIAPATPARCVRRRYRGATLVLETEFETDSGTVAVIDCMPPRSEAADLIRIVEGRSGRVPMRMELILRFDYGSIVPWVRRAGKGIRATAGPDTVYCRTTVDLRGEDMHTVADFTVAEGERHTFDFVWTRTHDPEPPEKDPEIAVRETTAWWEQWTGCCRYRGEWRDAVMRSLIVLKAMTYAPTGGLVAAPTTSLPEHLGGVRNWDYRYCWLRDATFALYALMIGGYVDEARHWRDWLVNAVAGTPSQIQIMYGLAGERRLSENVLDWLPGYESSRPVRTGNAAAGQHQLDVYGEVLDAMHLAWRAGLEPSENAWRVQQALLEFLETAWRQPDQGIWEVRGPRRHFTHSKVMAWVALDRGVKAVEAQGLPGRLDVWRRVRDEIHNEVCGKGFNPEINSFVQCYGGQSVDASLLMLPLVGFLPAGDPRMVGTVNAIQQRLERADGLIDRYATIPEIDGLPPGEGVFLLCTFWLADNLALQGRHSEAREIFERLLSLRNDVGLLAEEYDPASGRFLGNFPQAFSHVGLINTARNLTAGGGPAVHRQAKNVEPDDGLNPDGE